jgi:hypothetical protein
MQEKKTEKKGVEGATLMFKQRDKFSHYWYLHQLPTEVKLLVGSTICLFTPTVTRLSIKGKCFRTSNEREMISKQQLCTCCIRV